MLKIAFFALGIIIIVLTVFAFGAEGVITAIASANYFYIALAFLTYILTIALLTARMKVICKIPYKEAAKIVFSGLFFNVVTPIAKIGGEPAKIYMLKGRYGTSKSTAFVFLDTIVELLVSFMVFVVIMVVFAGSLPKFLLPSFIVFTVIIAIIFVVFLKICLSHGWSEKITRRLIKFVSRFRKVEDKGYARAFTDSFRLLVGDGKLLAGTSGITLGTKILEFLRLWLVFMAFGISLPLDVILLVWVVFLVLYMMPWLPGGLGIVEAGGAGAFIFFGVQNSIAVSGVLIERLITFWFVIVVGIAFGMTKLIKKGEKNAAAAAV